LKTLLRWVEKLFSFITKFCKKCFPFHKNTKTFSLLFLLKKKKKMSEINDIIDGSTQHFVDTNTLKRLTGDEIGSALKHYTYWVPGMSGTMWIDEMTPDQLIVCAERIAAGGRAYARIREKDGTIYVKPGNIIKNANNTFSFAMSGKDKMAAKLVSAYVDDFPCRFVDGDTSILPLPPPEGSGQKVVSIIPFAGPLIAVIGKLFQQVKNLTTRINNLQQENDSLAARSARATTATSPPAYGGPSQAENELKKVVENLEEQLRQARRQIDSLQEEKQNHVCNTGGGNAQAEAATLRGQVATLQRQVQSMSMNNAVQFFPGTRLKLYNRQRC
jgi:regulator of replication initiation timing